MTVVVDEGFGLLPIADLVAKANALASAYTKEFHRDPDGGSACP